MGIDNRDGKNQFANWQAPGNRPPQHPARPFEHVPVNKEADRTQLMGQIREIQSRVDEANRAAARLRRDGLSDQAYAKETTVNTLKFQMQRLQGDLGKIAN